MKKRYFDVRRGNGATWIAGLGVAAMSGLVSGCVKDTDCGVCDPDNLILQSLTGVNYSNKKVHVLSPTCEGENCPGDFTEGQYFIDDIGPCEETEEHNEATRPDEYCLISPMITFGGIEFVFNNLLDPTSIELVRKRPDNPQLFEVYDWKSQIASIRGPQTRFNGDYLRGSGSVPDQMARSINLTCIDNLAAKGQSFDVDDVGTDVCDRVFEEDGNIVPYKMQFEATMGSYRGETDWRAGSCDTPEEGADTCCTVCDYELSVNVYKYGANNADGGERLRPGAGAMTCDATGAGDKFRPEADGGCKGFVPYVERGTEPHEYTYEFNGEMSHEIPRYDKIRETHPDDRPENLEHSRANCQTTQDCVVTHGLKGAECVGEYENSGGACSIDGSEACINRHCVAEWFVDCVADANTTGGETGFCVDKRFKDRGAGACWVAESKFESIDPENPNQRTPVPSGQRLAHCDGNENGYMTAGECCQTSLGGGDGSMGATCDPIFSQLANLHPVERFDRNRQLPDETRDCFCGDPGNQPDNCRPLIEQFCTEHGAPPRHDGESNEGQYITRFVSKNGGVVYDPSLKGVDWRPGDLGAEPRALVESCAESQNEIGERNIMDGWRAGDGKGYETLENFDRALCSGQEYELVFASDPDGERIVDKVGNTLEGKEVYKFKTPQFHMVPGSGFPTDNLRIGACDSFEVGVSNKYDMSPANLRKIELHEVAFDGSREVGGESCSDLGEGTADCWVKNRVVAGGTNCVETADEVTEDAPPCLTVDVSDQWLGTVRVGIDTVEFGKRLYEADDVDTFDVPTTGRYRMVLPGLNDPDDLDRTFTSLEDLEKAHPTSSDKFKEIYQAAFHDACGMPLVTAGYEGEKDFLYDFSIDSPKCKEDKDADGVQLSCDNAGKKYNPDQYDADKDGFGDVVDLCVVNQSQTNTADSDKDGIGNDCDNCRQTASNYNENVMDAGVPAYMWVRNIPLQFDADKDGIGDACDNCPAVANCEAYDSGNPWDVTKPIDPENTNVCQRDDNNDMIGDECAGDAPLPGAAGPIGFGMDDDFDQDGIVNADDLCPRIPVEGVACQDDSECQANETCETGGNNQGVCNHRDTDADAVGNVCDSCPFAPNFDQITDGGMQEDDEDGDFVGAACETNAKCYIRQDPRPYAFFEVSADGVCCTTVYPGDGQYDLDNQNEDGTYPCLGLCDPDGLPIQADCQNEPEEAEDRIPDGVKCRKLPKSVLEAPGVVPSALGGFGVPPGCDEALTAAGKNPDGSDNPRLSLEDFANEVEMWNTMCFLPQWDQDFDGIGDACELKPSCEFAFDPNAEPYVDQNGKVWPDNGKYCSGDYDIENVCSKQQPGGGAETGTGTGTGGTDTGGTGDTGN